MAHDDIARRIYRANELLRLIFARLRAHKYALLGANMAPKCLLGRRTRLEHPWRIWMGTRCTLQQDVWLNVGSQHAELRVGDFTFIGRGTEIEVSHLVTIGKGCLIAPNVFITDHNHDGKLGTPIYQQPCIANPVHLGNDVWIGTHAVILPGVTIGDGAFVAGGAVVNNDVPSNIIVGGVPAKPIGERSA